MTGQEKYRVHVVTDELRKKTEPYTGLFENKEGKYSSPFEEVMDWRKKHGKSIKKELGRKLVLKYACSREDGDDDQVVFWNF